MTRNRLVWTVAVLLLLWGCGGPDDTGTGVGGRSNGVGGSDAGDSGGADVNCEGLNTCFTAGLGCSADGKDVVRCFENGDGCLVATTVQTCELECRIGTCVEDPCADIAADNQCPVLGVSYCDADVRTLCVLNGEGCPIWRRVACMMGETCSDEGDGAECLQACSNQCDAANYPICTGMTSETCTVGPLGCTELATLDCASRGQVCDANGVCANPPMAVCGDGVIELAETCDDGGTTAGDGCSANCTVEANWMCSGQPSTCVFVPVVVCGDGAIGTGEDCDDGGTVAGDGCSATCTVEGGYSCVGQPSTCTLDPVCGNGAVETGEGCDDGGTAAGDGCDGACVVESGYTCTGQPSSCALDPVCGNGAVEAGEGCDDGGTAAGDGCDAACMVEGGYSCTGMPSTCTLNAVCGDGAIGAGEGCDDSGVAPGDGCDAACAIESGWSCSGMPSNCVRLNSVCAGAINLTSGATVVADTTEANDDYGASCGVTGAGGELTYRIMVPAGQTLTVDAAPQASADASIAIAFDCAEVLGDTCAQLADAVAGGSAEQLVYTNASASPVAVIIVIDGNVPGPIDVTATVL